MWLFAYSLPDYCWQIVSVLDVFYVFVFVQFDRFSNIKLILSIGVHKMYCTLQISRIEKIVAGCEFSVWIHSNWARLPDIRCLAIPYISVVLFVPDTMDPSIRTEELTIQL